ncbi:MAG: SPOR domain-containing protein [Cardiobacteriaceae bacterium]|nr:SPOR domain-containing protein [Cardiobacteriaceae bacterium]
MTKWLSRLLGLLVLLLLVLFTFNTWFKPDTPDALRRDIDLQVRGQSVPPPQQQTPPEPEETALTPPALTLTSLEDFPADGGAAPVLANPQPEQPREAVAPPPVAPPKTEAPRTETARTETPKPAPAKPAPVAEAPPASGGKLIAAGAFGNPDNTKRRVEQLRSRGWPVKVEKIQSGGKTLDRVILGPVPAAQLNTYLDELNKMGIQGREIQ